MRDISKCYKKCKPQRYSFKTSPFSIRIYLSEKENLCFYSDEGNIDFSWISLNCFKRIKNEEN